MLQTWEPNLARAASAIFGKSYDYTRAYREFKQKAKAQQSSQQQEDPADLEPRCDRCRYRDELDWICDNKSSTQYGEYTAPDRSCPDFEPSEKEAENAEHR